MEEIYARGACSWGQYQRAEGSFETMGFKWRFFLSFFSLLKRKGKHSRKKTYDYPSVFLLRKNPAPPPSLSPVGDISPRWGESCP